MSPLCTIGFHVNWWYFKLWQVFTEWMGPPKYFSYFRHFLQSKIAIVFTRYTGWWHKYIGNHCPKIWENDVSDDPCRLISRCHRSLRCMWWSNAPNLLSGRGGCLEGQPVMHFLVITSSKTCRKKGIFSHGLFVRTGSYQCFYQWIVTSQTQRAQRTGSRWLCVILTEIRKSSAVCDSHREHEVNSCMLFLQRSGSRQLYVILTPSNTTQTRTQNQMTVYYYRLYILMVTEYMWIFWTVFKQKTTVVLHF